ncbi:MULTISPECIES: pantetheine-phosphate adenylyltransferase [Dietzia]|uniref:Phosphopantetheine adenylyltransferase n=2 Tax=Dietzia TaxID=37914 RepID=A0ABN2I2K9_9ACTN|nr:MULTISPECIES: pantetheine-phosphate adenylyltransferase [Dietzia]MBB1044269.1 pantetheine-phosphate adenylyltransferase [Dietzia sp. DQ11-44]MBB1048180.1 pantetheine-phosphate adenylyltransferase [Dietzia cercidiphylli]MBB1054796.1 pantetheine-phosphate adenylyltransferase [Dietzia sp. B44]MBB1058132.1 pantetheine-phosphate adenylyltransferase [Dietzia sp. B19]MCT1513855.1 pantetheine-phosphate adenylyltransferase [Dietzia cercidiphylli]
MTTVVCPGSFDPVTLGHLDIIRRSAQLFDDVIVCVVANPNKQGTFTIDERKALIEEVCTDLPGVRVDSFYGLLVDYCREKGATAVIKGLRDSTDYDYELPMAHMNRSIAGVDTVFLPTRADLAFVSSSLCREVTRLGGDVSHLLPDPVARALKDRLG